MIEAYMLTMSNGCYRVSMTTSGIDGFCTQKYDENTYRTFPRAETKICTNTNIGIYVHRERRDHRTTGINTSRYTT